MTAIEFDHVGKQYRYSPGLTEREAIFIASCIECAADSEGISPEEMYLRMHKVGLIDRYILPCYEALHSESRQNVTSDIINTLHNWERKSLQ